MKPDSPVVFSCIQGSWGFLSSFPLRRCSWNIYIPSGLSTYAPTYPISNQQTLAPNSRASRLVAISHNIDDQPRFHKSSDHIRPISDTPLKWRSAGGTLVAIQWRSQNAEKVTHLKGRLLDQAVILFNYPPFS